MLRRSSLTLVVTFVTLVAACDPYKGQGGTPVGVALMSTRTHNGGYTTYPKLNFYSVGNATFTFSNVNSDSCVVAPYDSGAVGSAPSSRLGASAYLLVEMSGDTDTVYKATTSDLTYAPSTLTGFTFNPGDSVTFNVAGDAAGFPPLKGAAMTAEPFTITTPTVPPVGQAMVINWTPATDNNAAMYISLIYNNGKGSGFNTQVFCDFHDDGQGTVQANLLPALSSSNPPWQMRAQRVRSALLTTFAGYLGYLNVISTFDVPTPVSP